MSDLAATLLVIALYVKASAQVLGKDIDRIHLKTEAVHIRLGQDDGMDWEHTKAW